MFGLRRLIGPKRLEAVPWTEYCVACRNKLERGEPSGVDMSGNDVPSPEFRFRTRTALRRKLGERLRFAAKDSAQLASALQS